MQNTSTTNNDSSDQTQTNYISPPQIYRLDMRNKILEFIDFTYFHIDPSAKVKKGDPIDGDMHGGKIGINLIEYGTDNKQISKFEHYGNADEVFLLCWKILWERFPQPKNKEPIKIFEEMKGTSGRNAGYPNLDYISRVLRISYRTDLMLGESAKGAADGKGFEFNYVIRPGSLEGKGLITPVKNSQPLQRSQAIIPKHNMQLAAKVIESYISGSVARGGQIRRERFLASYANRRS